MSSFLSPGWYRAVRVPSSHEQRTLFTFCERLLSTLSCVVSVVTFMTEGNQYAVIYSLTEIPSSTDQQRIEQVFLPYTPFVTLPEAILDALLRERMSKDYEVMQSARRQQMLTTHTPHLISYEIPEDEASDPVQESSSLLASVRTLLAEGVPFIDVYAMTLSTEHFHPGTLFPRRSSQPLAAIAKRLLEYTQLWRVSASAHAMHQALLRYDQDVCTAQGWETPEALFPHYGALVSDLFQQEPRLWIEYEEPLQTLVGTVKAVLVHPGYLEREINDVLNPSQDLETWIQMHALLGRAHQRCQMKVIGEDTTILLTLGYDSELNCWVLPQDLDLITAQEWMQWLAMMHGMMQKRYARSPQEPDFPVQQVTYQTKERVPRKHGCGKPKEKWVSHTRTYTHLRYEVSLQQDVPSSPETIEQAHGKRGNWLAEARPEDLLYERRTIDPYVRAYPRRKDGTRQEGKVSVHYHEPKWVVLLRPEKRKRRVIKQAVAHTYQAQEPQPSSIGGVMQSGPLLPPDAIMFVADLDPVKESEYEGEGGNAC
ncbi:hypothetical protein [Ktedonospora formicarum]|uniref:Uncharacterized protein n=1 Tax=Ktedonospora formicarum TaxID=2778364 RepID=A0A8J3I7W3_9CHLR|nr:hypothetical protein [Ktedonospora formicarum]GHO48480.1 hypothetical protein KSX_66430 [Ktedonospora formicarum]